MQDVFMTKAIEIYNDNIPSNNDEPETRCYHISLLSW